jgi:hypothetical protein
MIEIFDRSSCNPKLFISISSIIMEPSLRANLNNALIIDDFPAPVLPTIPI